MVRFIIILMGNSQKSIQRGVKGPRGVIQSSYLQISCRTTSQTPHSLFDYHSKNPKKEELAVKTSAIAVREEGDGVLIMQPISHLSNQLKQTISCGVKFIIHRTPTKKGFLIEPFKISMNGKYLQKAIWSVVKYMPKNNHILKQGDIFRVGLQKIKVKQIVHKKQSSRKSQTELNTIYTIYETLTKFNKDILKDYSSNYLSGLPCCRICLDEGSNKDPLIPPCKCLGSMKYIHIKCLRDWMQTKMQYSQMGNNLSISWKLLICQLCKTSYMHQIYLDGKKYYTVDIPVPQKPYIVLELISKNDICKFYELISFSSKSVQTIGQSYQSDICLPHQLYISKQHCIIEYRQSRSQFLLSDLVSKYGTLLLERNPIKVDQQHQAYFQIGRSVFNIRMIKGQNQPQMDIDLPLAQEEEDENINLGKYSKQEKSSEGSYQIESSISQIGDFTRPVEFYNLNADSIRHFQTNLNESGQIPQSQIARQQRILEFQKRIILQY